MFLPRPSPNLSVTERFAAILHSACVVVTNAACRRTVPDAVAVLIVAYLKRVTRRFLRLAEMARNGTLRPPRPRPLPAEGAEPPKRKPREKPLIRMRGYGWITRHVIGAVPHGTQIRALLDVPDMAALVRLDARFGAMIRPLLTALATEPHAGQLPEPVPRRQRPRPPKEPKPPKPRKVRAKKVRWWCARPPRAGLVFSDESLN